MTEPRPAAAPSADPGIPPAERAWGTWGDALWFAIGSGIVAGYLDRGAMALRAAFVEPLVFVGRHAWWTIPIATVALFVVVALVQSVAVRLIGRRRWLWPLATWTFAFLALFACFYSFPQFHRVAAIVLSAGIATTLTRRVGEPGAAGRARLGRLTAIAVGSVAIVAAGFIAKDRLRARAALAHAVTGGPNVLLIVLDTVRSLNLSLYGYHRETTPSLAKWASRGVVFDRAYSTAPWTLPSHASIMTGRWMHEVSADWMVRLDGADPTLAEELTRRGYRTGGFVANTDYCSTEVGLDRGFGWYQDYTLDWGQMARSSSLWRALARISVIRQITGAHGGLGRRTAPKITSAFLAWLERGPDRPFFGFLNYYDAHRPYFPPEPWADRFRTPGIPLNTRYRKENGSEPNPTPERIQGAIDAYDNAIGYLDSEIGRLLDRLERDGRLTNTVVIITADHGEEFFEHGLWDHGNSLYQASVRVPLVVIGPGVPAGVRVDQPVSVRSIPATVAGLTGVIDSTRFPGQSLARTWLHPAADDTVLLGVRQVPRQPLWYPVTRGNLVSAATRSWQFIRNLGDGTGELFRLDADTARKVDPAADSAAAIAAARLERRADAIRFKPPSP